MDRRGTDAADPDRGCATPAVTWRPDEEPRDDLVALGRLVETGRWKQAAQVADRMAADDPRAAYLVARVHAHFGRVDAALALLDAAAACVDAHPRWAPPSFRSALEDLRFSVGRTYGAWQQTAAYCGGNEAASSDWRCLEAAARLAQQDGDGDAAEAAWQRALAAAAKQAPRKEYESLRLAWATWAVRLGGNRRALDVLEELARTGSMQVRAAAARQWDAAQPRPLSARQWPAYRAVVTALLDRRVARAAQQIAEQWSAHEEAAVAREARFFSIRAQVAARGDSHRILESLEEFLKPSAPWRAQAYELKAKVLARLHRDEEAAAAYLTAAALSPPRQAALDRYYAGRLYYYLDQHERAWRLLRRLAPLGARSRAGLSQSVVRDIHFFAGMSAFLLHRYRPAARHFAASGAGSTHGETRARSRYWRGRALLHGAPGRGVAELQSLCQEQPTSWYGLWAARQLQRASKPVPASCLVLGDAASVSDMEAAAGGAAQKDGAADKGSAPVSSTEGGVPQPHGDTDGMDAAVPGSPPWDAVVPWLRKEAPAALFWASMGLYDRAARQVKVQVRMRDLDATAPPVAVLSALGAAAPTARAASVGLRWPPEPAHLWRWHLAYPTPYAQMVRRAEARWHLPSMLVWAVMRKESFFDPHARSYAGAVGLMQMMPATYERNRRALDVPPLPEGGVPEPAAAIATGAAELGHLLEAFDGRVVPAIMAYNAGPAAVRRWIQRAGHWPADVFVEKAGFAQTRNYVRRVFQNWVRYRFLYGLPLPGLPERDAASAP